MSNTVQTQQSPSFLSRHRGKMWALTIAISFALGFGVAWGLRGDVAVNTSTTSNPEHAHVDETAKIWTCSMHPQIRRDGPGKCPICSMDLVPVTVSDGGPRSISISPTARKLMNIQTVPVEYRHVTAEVRMVGKVEYDETKLAHITAWVSGRLDRLYVDYTGIEVKQGDHMVYIYSEELYSAQEELIQALKFRRNRAPSTTTLVQPIDLVESAREKLRLLGLTEEQTKEIEKRKKPTDHITVYAPNSGIVIEKLRQQGDRVRTGDRIYTVADLTQVWVKFDAYESDLMWLRYGQQVEFSTEAFPGETFAGRIAFIDPVLDKETRTVKVRVNVPNEDGRLKPEMFARAIVRSQVAAGGQVLDAALAGKWISPMHPEIIKDEPGVCDICGMPLVRAETMGYIATEADEESKPLVIPRSAALVTGTRAIVYVEVPTAKKPTFEGREIVLGPRAGEYYLVRHGLAEGELVVTNGNFKLDSALQISAKPSMMTPEGGGGGGHDHGGEKKTQTAESSPHKMTLPSQFRSHLEQILTSFDETTAAIESGELVKIRESFNKLGKTVSQIEQKELLGHVATLWSEFSMLLANDAVEGSEVSTLQDADRVYLLLKRHIRRVRDQFGIGHREQVVRIEVPSEFQVQLGRLWKAYLPIGQALAADDFSLARKNIEKVQTALTSIDDGNLKDDALAVWQKEQGNLRKIVVDFTQASDIKTARSAFTLFSDEMIVLVRIFGLGDASPIYELHCPMAFKGRGASWLQDNDQARNPYFGATMLKCADSIKLVSPQDDARPSVKEHEGHNHKR